MSVHVEKDKTTSEQELTETESLTSNVDGDVTDNDDVEYVNVDDVYHTSLGIVANAVFDKRVLDSALLGKLAA